MSGLLTRRKLKAASLVPLALLSAAWTASIAGAESSASAAKHRDHGLPDGTSVPSSAIKAPASVPIPGAIAPAVPNGTADSVVAGASTSGIPSAALSAYQRAAQIIDAADTTCNIPWELIAAIGRVESNHGQYGGNTLDLDGVSRPGIYGPQLNGKNGTQAITDTDGGQLDKDAVYDRAVGPMQFIPSTWAAVKVDADGDGERNPQDVDDASLASAVYLCSGTEDLSSRAGQDAAVYRYNHSRQYVELVLRIMEAYSQGDYTAIPSGTYGGTVFTPSYTATIRERKVRAAKAAKAHAAHSKSTSSSSSTSGSSGSSTGGTSLPGTSGTGTPSTGTVTNPVTKAVQGVTGTLDSATGGATAPLSNTLNTLTEAEATTLCKNQLGATVYALIGGTCVKETTGQTETNALSIIANLLKLH